MDAAAILVRPAAMGDVPGIRECVGAVAGEGRYLAFTKPYSFIETAFYLARVLDAGHPYFIAIDDQSVVGWCDVTPARGDVHAHVGVLGMGVLRKWRERGVGRRLIGAALDAASIVFEQVELHVYASNDRAGALPQIRLRRAGPSTRRSQARRRVR